MEQSDPLLHFFFFFCQGFLGEIDLDPKLPVWNAYICRYSCHRKLTFNAPEVLITAYPYRRIIMKKRRNEPPNAVDKMHHM